MTNDINAINIHNRLNLYMVKTKKFKTDLIGIYVKRHLSREEAALNALLTRLLMRGTKKYPSSKALNIQLEASYGMILVSDVVKYGEYHILQFKLQFPNAKHIMDKNIFEDALEILKEVIFDPYLVDGSFDPDYFNQEKENLMDEIHSRVNDKMSYSLERCIECMYPDEPYGEYVYGDVESIQDITLEKLYSHYQDVLKSSLVDICVMGDIDYDVVKDQITTVFPIQEEAYEDAFFMCEQSSVTSVQEIKEEFPVQQGKLVVGYRTHICQTDPLYEASVLAYHILGGGATSKLFQKLREESSLCYYVYAKSDKFKGCLLIGAGIDGEHYELVKEEIAIALEDLKQELVSEKELTLAIDAMVSSIKSLSDFPNSFINFYYTEVLGQPLDHNADLNSMITAYQNVTLEDLKKVYNLLELDTIYFIHGGDQ